MSRRARRVGSARPLVLAAALACAHGAAVPAPPEDAHGPGVPVMRYDGPADAVYLRGSMTCWDPVPLERGEDGFSLTLAVPPGRYEYHLEVHRAGTIRVVVPEGAERTDDGFGGENAILRVP